MSEPLLVGRYKIVNPLAPGGFSQTFLARDTQLPGHPLCVVKQLKPPSHDSFVLETATRLFETEAKILHQLGEHAQIPRLLAHFVSEGNFYLVQQYIAGNSLTQEFIPGKQWNPGEVLLLLQDVLTTLKFVHEHQVIHRDLKPANLIRRDCDGKIVLIDFGAVKTVLSHSQIETAQTIAIGTPGYLPPEQARGKPNFTSDLYAVGMIGIQALTGIAPHHLPDDPRTGELQWRDRLQDTDNNLFLFSVLDRLVRCNFQQRYQTVSEVLEALLHLETLSLTSSKSQSEPLFNRKERGTLGQGDTRIEKNRTMPASNHLQEISPTLPPPSLPKISPSSSPRRNRDRQILINKVRNFWVKGVLEASLHGRAMIELGLESRLDLVERPWGVVWGTPDSQGELLPSGVKVSDRFREMGAGRSLLILGEPGSGKTTTLLQLTRDLLIQAEQEMSEPIPVVFNLSSWSHGKKAIADWLISEFKVKYQVAPAISTAWLKAGTIRLLLDGLDEVDPQLQDACIKAINQFYQDHGNIEIVVCSRIQDYQQLKHRLNLQTAICIQSLSFSQIEQYFEDVGENLRTVKIAFQDDSTLQELAKSPLMLSIMTLAYQGISPEDFPTIQEIDLRRKHLFRTYIQRMFDRRVDIYSYSPKQVVDWLSWLAKRLNRQSQTVFLIERMQPNWLQSRKQKIIYTICLFISFLIIGGFFGYQTLPEIKFILATIFTGFLFCIIFGVYRINPVETLSWSGKKARKNLLLGIILGPILLFPFKFIYQSFILSLNTQTLAFDAPSLFSFSRGIIFGLSLGIVYGIIRGFQGATVQRKTFPNQGIFQSAFNSLLFAGIGFGILGISAIVIQWYPKVWVTLGLFFGLTAGGGEACVKHCILRLILYFSGSIPWNYARFLDYATGRLFLQKVGGGYIFIHRLLLEYFANEL